MPLTRQTQHLADSKRDSFMQGTNITSALSLLTSPDLIYHLAQTQSRRITRHRNIISHDHIHFQSPDPGVLRAIDQTAQTPPLPKNRGSCLAHQSFFFFFNCK